jgi:hypothetical protein
MGPASQAFLPPATLHTRPSTCSGHATHPLLISPRAQVGKAQSSASAQSRRALLLEPSFPNARARTSPRSRAIMQCTTVGLLQPPATSPRPSSARRSARGPAGLAFWSTLCPSAHTLETRPTNVVPPQSVWPMCRSHHTTGCQRAEV